MANAASAGHTASSGGAVTRPAAGSSVPRCREGHLSTGLFGAETSGRHVGFILALTNTGSLSCSLFGYPGLGLEDSSHHSLPSHTFWGPTFFDSDPGRSLIVLSPGETASASFAFKVANGGGSLATYLVVTPPNAHDHATLQFSRAMAIRIKGGNLHVAAMATHTPHP
jgi:Protein of unknown function (DUF4232)